MLNKPCNEVVQKNEQDNYSPNNLNKQNEFKFINFFDLNPDTFNILNPYNLDNALKAIENITEEKYKKNYLDDFYKKDFEFRGYEEDINFSIDNISFLTSTIIDEKDSTFTENKSMLKINNKKNVFISLINFLKSNVIIPINF